MIEMSYEQFNAAIKAEKKKAVEEFLTDRNRRIRLAIDMLENDIDSKAVIKLLNKILEDVNV